MGLTRIDLFFTQKGQEPLRVRGTIYTGPRKPGLVRVFLTQEKETGMLKFSLVIEPPRDRDVVSREVAVIVGEGTPVILEAIASPRFTDESGRVMMRISSPLFFGPDNAIVKVSVVDVDDAGNPSPPRAKEFVLLDTIAPHAPGDINLEAEEETEDPAPPVAGPEPTPPPAVEPEVPPPTE